MVTDPIADLLVRLKNAQAIGWRTVSTPVSKVIKSVLEVLKNEGFINQFSQKKNEETGHDEFEVVLKYYETGEPMIASAKRVSKPGRRVYSGCDKLTGVNRGLGLAVVSTSQGVMSDREARQKKIGGEVLAVIS